jgi:hypothetical protein
MIEIIQTFLKEGDIVICIDSADHSSDPLFFHSRRLTYGKEYTIKRIGNYKLNSSISITNDIGMTGIYNLNRFVTLSKWREIRLNEILEE